MKDRNDQLLFSKYEKLENILTQLSLESEKISDDLQTANGKLLTGSLDEAVNFMKKILDDHKALNLPDDDNEELFSFLNSEE